MSAFYSPDLNRTGGKAILGKKPGDIIGFYNSVGTAQPASTLSTRQALEALGLVKAGGSDTVNTDALSKVADDTLTDGVDYALGTSTGTKFATAANQKLAFHGATPIVQRAGSAQALVTLTGGVALAGSLTGTTDGTIVDIAATAGSCAGTTTPSATNVDSAIATAVASIVTGTNTQLKEIMLLLNKAIADNVLLTTLVNELRAADVAKGLIKGAA
jgi:hypothetical protein